MFLWQILSLTVEKLRSEMREKKERIQDVIDRAQKKTQIVLGTLFFIDKMKLVVRSNFFLFALHFIVKNNM